MESNKSESASKKIPKMDRKETLKEVAKRVVNDKFFQISSLVLPIIYLFNNNIELMIFALLAPFPIWITFEYIFNRKNLHMKQKKGG